MPILADPSVSSVECLGPGIPLSINKYGAIQNSKITFTNEEIQSVLKEISDNTRIPIIAGVFKAAFDNLVITAVISEYVGTRFLIQKKPQSSRFAPPNPGF